MNTKEKILALLYEKKGVISGQEIATLLSISRNSVWKAINQLKADGYLIASSSNGYALDEEGMFDEYNIRKGLKRNHKLHIYKKEGSSNTIAKELCRQGEEEGSVVIVESQTQGKGRCGRSFLSESENGLYMSIILRPTIPAEESINITVLCAVTVLEAIEKLSGKNCLIKWVNDIYIGEKKCCGILTEAAMDFESGSLEYAVVGIGINLCPPNCGFDEEIAEIACGVYEKEYPKGFKAALCAEIINCFFDEYGKISQKNFIHKYREKSSIIGKEVDVYRGDEVISGIAVDIDMNASLIVKGNNGQMYTFNSGEARVRKANEKR